MVVKTKFLVLAMLIILPTLPHQVRASQMSREFSQVIERFSVWKGQTENVVLFCKSSPKVTKNEIPALRFMYKQVRVNINSLIERIVGDLKTEKGNIDSERYNDSLVKAQRSVNDLNNYIRHLCLPCTKQKEGPAGAIDTGIPPVFLSVVGGVVSFVGATIAIIDYLEKQHVKANQKEIIKSLENLKLRAF
jgi:hypothetical protein